MKKYFRALMPEMAYVQVESDFKMFLSMVDVSGPSFDLSYDKTKAFYQYEKTDKDLIEKHIADGDVFLDVGANIGHFSFYFKKKYPNLKCHLFEPIPWLGDCIQTTIEKNKITDVEHHKVALSDHSGDDEFFIDTFNDGGHSLLKDKVSKRGSTGKSVKVKLKTLDSYNFEKVDFMKVDVQGAEKLFIQGAKQTIQKFRPKMLIEVSSKESLSFLKFLEKETGISYEVFSSEKEGLLTENDLSSLVDIFSGKGIEDCNYLYVPKC
ncbi:MAG: hypothetical protein CME70_04115 [Halobacteriovorax sp.]|nr:hypothetical protein [Halobacteriovorax sp.]